MQCFILSLLFWSVLDILVRICKPIKNLSMDALGKAREVDVKW